jgi:hypothetical protein
MEKERSKNCEICESEATCLCFKCNFYLCDKCYKIIHDLKKSQGHKKELIDSFIYYDLKCPLHKNQQNSLFCLDDKSKKSLYNILFYFFINILPNRNMIMR